MNANVLTFFNNKGGVGKTSLVYHVAWMLSKKGCSILAVDLDPQANLTAAFLDESLLERLWDDETDIPGAATVHQCVEPLTKVGDVLEPTLQEVAPGLYLLPGDLLLSGFEDLLSTEWPNCLGHQSRYRSFRVVTAFWQVIQMGTKRSKADVVLVDVGPSLGAVNRSALIATDHVVVPLGPDLFSRQGLRNLGPTLRRWRNEWEMRRQGWEAPEFGLPRGMMQPVGYMIQQHGVRLSRPVKAYDRWARRMPTEYARHVLGQDLKEADPSPDRDRNCVATIKHYRSLVALGQDARKPIFMLTPADGAIGSHAVAARQAYDDFEALADELLRRCGFE